MSSLSSATNGEQTTVAFKTRSREHVVFQPLKTKTDTLSSAMLGPTGLVATFFDRKTKDNVRGQYAKIAKLANVHVYVGVGYIGQGKNASLSHIRFYRNAGFLRALILAKPSMLILTAYLYNGSDNTRKAGLTIDTLTYEMVLGDGTRLSGSSHHVVNMISADFEFIGQDRSPWRADAQFVFDEEYVSNSGTYRLFGHDVVYNEVQP
jgi:hypothetical protein